MTSDIGTQLLSPDGVPAAGHESLLGDDALLEAYRWMVFSRTLDERAVSLQRQGRIGTYAAAYGQEASVIGSALALDVTTDWIVPQYRESTAMIRHGYPLKTLFLYYLGNPLGALLPDDVRIAPVQISLAAQLPHAVGLAWGRAMQGQAEVVMTYCGDGASSEGDFHEACNFAGVVKAPVVFVLQNNGYAISTPRSKQSAAANLASRAVGYGLPGELVDGNDLFAVYDATTRAVERARTGGGPTLIEAKTYRYYDHQGVKGLRKTYRSVEEVEQWRERDAIESLQRAAVEADLVTQEEFDSVWAEVQADAAEAIEFARQSPMPDVKDFDSNVYSD